MDLIQFLEERIAEDEAVARRTTGPWKFHPESLSVVLPTARHVPDLAEIVSTPRAVEDARHIVCWDSARVLAECEAKRRVIGEHQNGNGSMCSSCGDGGEYGYGVRWPCLTLRFLAMPYADHPDYDEEWRPDA